MALLLGFGANCFAQGKVTRPTQQQAQTSKPKQTTPRATVSDPDGYINGHGYVDLGLPSGTKWATCNVRATSPSGYGNYFAWGEVKVKKRYLKENSITHGKDKPTLYEEGFIDSNGVLSPSYDVATVKWGSNWKIPTYGEFCELIDNCNQKVVVINNLRGWKLTGPNNKSIFLPAAGCYDSQGKIITTGWNGFYFTSNCVDNEDEAFHIFFLTTSDKIDNAYSTYPRYCGCTIRPVLK